MPKRITTSNGRHKQRGLTLIELMVSITLSFVIVLAATALFVSSKSSYLTQDSSSVLNDTGRYALENIGRAVRQAGFEQWARSTEEAPLTLKPHISANLSGLDAKSLENDQSPGISKSAAPVNNSDVLAVRFFGSGITTKPDGSIVDCAGIGISEPSSPGTVEQDRGWSIYYVALAADGVPELHCRRMKDGGGAWSSHAIARGVEAFQVLYGVDTDGDRIPNQFMNATKVNELDKAIMDALPSEMPEADKQVAKTRNTHWKKISAIKVALLIQGPDNRTDDAKTVYCLFGKSIEKDGKPDCEYDSSKDLGTKINEKDLPHASRHRKLFTATFHFRNAVEGEFK